MMQTGESANYLLIWYDSFFNFYSDILRKTSTLDFNSCFFLMVNIRLKRATRESFLGGSKNWNSFKLMKTQYWYFLILNTYLCGSLLRALEISTIYGKVML